MATILRLASICKSAAQGQYLQKLCAAEGFTATCTDIKTIPQLNSALSKQTYDIVILSDPVSAHSIERIVGVVHAFDADLPCLGFFDDENAEKISKAFSAGIRDYFTPNNLWRFGHVIRREHYDLRRKRLDNRFEHKLDKKRKRLQHAVENRTAELEATNHRLSLEIRKRAALEKTLRMSRERYRKVIDNQAELVVRFGPDGKLTFVNDSWCRTLGKKRKDMIGNYFFLLAPREYRAMILNHLEPDILERNQCRLTFPIYTGGGELRWFLWTFHSERSPNGEMIEHQAVGRDITDQKRMEEDLSQANRLLSTILDYTHTLVAYLDTEFNYVRVNNAYAGMTGREAGDFQGKNHFELYPDKENQALFLHVVESGQPFFAYARPFVHDDIESPGLSYWDWSLAPTKDEHGQVTGIVMTLADVTARKMVERQLQLAHDELEKRVAIRSAELFRSNELLKTEISERIKAQSALMQRHQVLESIYAISTSFGSSLEAIFDQIVLSISKMLSAPLVFIGTLEDDRFSVRSQVRDGMYSHKGYVPITSELAQAMTHNREAYQSNSGLSEVSQDNDFIKELAASSLVAVPIKNNNEEVLGMIAGADRAGRVFEGAEVHLMQIFARYAAHEIERTRLAAQLREDQELKVLGQLTSGVAHEVRNPLNAIIALTEALSLEISEKGNYRLYMEHISSHVSRLAMLMQDLLELGNPLRPNRVARCSMVSLVKDSWQSWRDCSAFGHRRVIMDYPPEAENWLVSVDKEKIKQVFYNALENACQHSPLNTEIQLSLLCSENGDFRVRIIDHGAGVSDQDLPHVFAPFYTTRTGGTGLGLTVSRRILQAHRGSMTLNNNTAGKGATAEIRLPALSLAPTKKVRKEKAFAA